MPEIGEFSGFPKECVAFYRALKRHNDKHWFAQHKREFDEYVIAPAQAFVVTMGERLSRIAPGIHADPRFNRSIFRIQRDTRFSPDKTPFKTHLGLWFWEGDGPRMECSGFYVHLEPPHFLLGVGLYIFPKHQLEEYRQSLVDKRHGTEFTRIAARITRGGIYTFGREHYKRVPRGYDPQHPNAGYLLYNGLYAGLEVPIPPAFHTAKLPDYCLRHFKATLPVHRWLVAMIERAGGADNSRERRFGGFGE
jgi:uncharacterized protein (TIGR02453 family)